MVLVLFLIRWDIIVPLKVFYELFPPVLKSEHTYPSLNLGILVISLIVLINDKLKAWQEDGGHLYRSSVTAGGWSA